MNNFPMIMYKCPGPFKKPRGGFYNICSVLDESQYLSKLSDGWFPSYAEARNGKLESQSDLDNESDIDQYSPPTRDELESKAKALGIIFDGRTSDKKLLARISEILET